MQKFYVYEHWAHDEQIVPIHFERPYTDDARRFARIFWRTYSDTLSLSAAARQLGLPRTTLQYWIKQK